MKRFCLLLALLLLAASALAEYPSSGDLMNGWPVEGVSTQDTDYILMLCPDGTKRLYCKLTEGVPTVFDPQAGDAAVLSTPLPADVQLTANPFGEPVVIFAAADGGTVTATIRREGDVWRIYELAEDSGYRWMYAGGALITEDTDAVIGAPGFETDITKADWLALPASYEAALAMMPPDAEVCNNLDYWLGQETAMFLLQRPDGTIVLACTQRTEDGGSPAGIWRVTYSAPLPEGTYRLDTYHASEGSIAIFLPEGDANVALQPDGRWLLTWARDVSIGENGLWFGAGGPYYCDVPMERDMTRIDCASLPVAYEDWLPLVDASAWAVVTGAPAPLRGEDGSVIAEYLPATPVRLLEARGDEVRVAIAGSDVTGWMEVCTLLIGEDQLDLNGGEGFTVVEDGFVWGVNSVVAAEGAWLFDAPGGEPLREADFRMDVLAVCGDWLHVLDGAGTAGFVRAEDCTDFHQWLRELREAYDLP